MKIRPKAASIRLLSGPGLYKTQPIPPVTGGDNNISETKPIGYELIFLIFGA